LPLLKFQPSYVSRWEGERIVKTTHTHTHTQSEKRTWSIKNTCISGKLFSPEDPNPSTCVRRNLLALEELPVVCGLVVGRFYFILKYIFRHLSSCHFIWRSELLFKPF